MKQLTLRTAEELDIMYGNRDNWRDKYIAYDKQVCIDDLANSLPIIDVKTELNYKIINDDQGLLTSYGELFLAIKENPKQIVLVKDPSFDIIQYAIKMDPSVITFFPDANERLYVEAVLADKTSSLIAVLPKDKITITVALAAFKTNVGAIGYIPEEFLNEDMCIEAIEELGFEVMKIIPKKFHTERVTLEAIKQNGLALYFSTCKTKKVREAAIKDFPLIVLSLQEGEYDVDDIVLALSNLSKDEEYATLSIGKMLSKLEIPDGMIINHEAALHYIDKVPENILSNYREMNDTVTWKSISANLTNVINLFK